MDNLNEDFETKLTEVLEKINKIQLVDMKRYC